jgi:hypothetical protein
LRFEDEVADPPPLPPLTPIERRAFDYSTLEEAMVHLDAVVRQARHNLGALLGASGVELPASLGNRPVRAY